MKKLLIIITFLVLCAGGIALYAHNHRFALSSSSQIQETPDQAKTKAWDIFQEYLNALKTHNLSLLKSITYQLSDTCKDPKQINECYQKMDSVYQTISGFKESDFTHVAYDEKQIILYTDWSIYNGNIIYGYQREIIYFTRLPDGMPQFLSVTLPTELVYTLKGKGETEANWTKELTPRLKDSDGDTLEDEVETCTYPDAPATCVKTDPNKKDTNGNGWWDSIEDLFYVPVASSTATSTK